MKVAGVSAPKRRRMQLWVHPTHAYKRDQLTYGERKTHVRMVRWEDHVDAMIELRIKLARLRLRTQSYR
jgi:hypothetical protein